VCMCVCVSVCRFIGLHSSRSYVQLPDEVDEGLDGEEGGTIHGEELTAVDVGEERELVEAYLGVVL
jgi:hypothetical protein